jgi:hypothetical protein
MELTMKLGRVMVPLMAVLLFCLAGCRQQNRLSGEVTYNGEPVEMGSVTFTSADGSGPGFGAQVVDGTYSTDKVKLGEHVANVRGLSKATFANRKEYIKLREQQDNRYGLPVDYIPEDAEGNGQTVDIEGGEQTLDFDVKGPPRAG